MAAPWGRCVLPWNVAASREPKMPPSWAPRADRWPASRGDFLVRRKDGWVRPVVLRDVETNGKREGVSGSSSKTKSCEMGR